MTYSVCCLPSTCSFPLVGAVAEWCSLTVIVDTVGAVTISVSFLFVVLIPYSIFVFCYFSPFAVWSTYLFIYVYLLILKVLLCILGQPQAGPQLSFWMRGLEADAIMPGYFTSYFIVLYFHFYLLHLCVCVHMHACGYLKRPRGGVESHQSVVRGGYKLGTKCRCPAGAADTLNCQGVPPASHTQLFRGCWGSELKSSCPQVQAPQHFNHQGSFPSLP